MNPTPRTFVVGLLALALAAPPTLAAKSATKPARVSATHNRKPGDTPVLEQLGNRYAMSLARHRPDLAERYGATPLSVRFVPLDEATLDGHVRELRQLLRTVDSLASSVRGDSLRVRLRRELAECAPDGALHRDAFVWLDIVDAAARAPFLLGAPNGCDRTRRAALQMRTLPEALRAAVVLMRGAPAPDPAALESRLGQVERSWRVDLPSRTEPCKEGRRRAEFAEADSLAAASLAQFRRWLSPGR